MEFLLVAIVAILFIFGLIGIFSKDKRESRYSADGDYFENAVGRHGSPGIDELR